jgi:hypothetical protein
MKADQYSKFNAIKVKARANYQCQICSSDKMVQAHAPNGDHSDWHKGICLCAECHSKQHPEVPRNLFFTATQQPYWPNISARALAHEFNCHNRTIIRAARTLGISQGVSLSTRDRERLRVKTTKIYPANTISIKGAALLLGISRAYLYYLKDVGDIRVDRIGSRYVIAQKEIDRYKDEHTSKSDN